MTREAWTFIDVDGPRTLVYGPRFGRLYLLTPEQARDPSFTRAVGLASGEFESDLSDPAEHISVCRSASSDGHDPPVLKGVGTAYRLFAASRQVLPFRMVATRLPRLAELFRRDMPRRASSADIGRIVAAAEGGFERGNCYPRALATAVLCLAAGHACTLAIGVLSPTRKMHAWCGVEGCLPYEPTPEHFLYQPLWTLRLLP